MANLYRLTADALALRDKVYESLDTETGEIDTGLSDALALKQDEVTDKIVAVAQIRRELYARIVEAKAEIARITAIKERMERAVSALEKDVLNACEALGIKRIDTNDCVISFRKSEAVEIYNEAAIPEFFIDTKVTKTVNKTAIKQAIRDGLQVDGARLVERQNIQFK